jgi:hypothetical protein
MAQAFYERDDWDEYVQGARAFEHDPAAFEAAPLFIKLEGMSATRELENVIDRFTAMLGHDGTETQQSVTIPSAYVAYRDEQTNREWFRDTGPKIKWRGFGRNDAEFQRQMLLLARDKWPDEPLKLHGTRAFKRSLYDVAYTNGIAIEGPEFDLYKKHRDMDRKIAQQEDRDNAYRINQPRRSPAYQI